MRPGGHVGFVGIAHDVQIPGDERSSTRSTCTKAPSPCAGSCPTDPAIWNRRIDPGKVFDLTLPLEDAARRYKAMDERRATKVLLTL